METAEQDQGTEALREMVGAVAFSTSLFVPPVRSGGSANQKQIWCVLMIARASSPPADAKGADPVNSLAQSGIDPELAVHSLVNEGTNELELYGLAVGLAASLGVPLIDLCGAAGGSEIDCRMALEIDMPLKRRLREFRSPFRSSEQPPVEELRETREPARLVLSTHSGMAPGTARALSAAAVFFLLAAAIVLSDTLFWHFVDAHYVWTLILGVLAIFVAAVPVSRELERFGTSELILTRSEIEIRRTFVLRETVRIPLEKVLALRVSARLYKEVRLLDDPKAETVPVAAFLDVIVSEAKPSRIRMSVAAARRARWLIENFLESEFLATL